MRRFQRLAYATIAATYLLILVGALVRASGAGMGCPDWPQCFGRWVPPTDLRQVPAQLAPYFSVRLAWTEYLNRLLGSVTGLLIFATVVFAVRDHRARPRVMWSAVGAFVGVGLAGWLGKRVVEKKLDPAFVTVHMFVALAVVSLLIYAAACASWSTDAAATREARDGSEGKGIFAGTLAVIGVVLVQIALGTRVRASVELVQRADPHMARGAWLARVGGVDHAHRALAFVVVALAVGLATYVRRATSVSTLRWLSALLAIAAVGQAVAGAGLAYLALPPVLQVFHVTVGSLLLGGLVALAVLSSRAPTVARRARTNCATWGCTPSPRRNRG